MKRIILLSIFLISFSYSQAVDAKRARVDSLKSLSANYGTLDSIYIKSRVKFTRPVKIDSSITLSDTLLKTGGGIAYKNSNLYFSDGTSWMKLFGISDTSTLVTKNTTQVITAPKYWTAPQYFVNDSTTFKRQYGSTGTGTGTVITKFLNDTVFGTETLFQSELIVGGLIYISGTSVRTIETIISNDTLVTTAIITSALTNVSYTYNTIVNFAKAKFQNGAFVINGDTSYYPFFDKAQNTLLWYPSKGAIRSGIATGTQWDSANIGAKSSAFGLNNTASGVSSFSIGNGNTASGDYSFVGGASNTNGGGSSFLFGSNLRINSGLTFNYLFGSNITTLRQTLGGFAYTNSADTIRFGHSTVSGGVPFVAHSFSGTAGNVLNWYALSTDASQDSSTFTMQQYLGVNGSAGTSTTSLEFTKFKNTSSSNFDRYDGNKYLVWQRVDTSNNILFNDAKSSDFTYGYMQLTNGNFTVSAGYTDQDSLRRNGSTIITGTYHSGLGAWAGGNASIGTLTTNGNTATVGNVTSSGTISTTGTGAHTFATAGSGFTVYRDGGSALMLFQTYGNATGSIYAGYAYGGTRASPTQISSGQIVGTFRGNGYINANDRQMGHLQFYSSSTPSSTNYGTYARVQLVPDSSTTMTTHNLMSWTNGLPDLTIGTTAKTGLGNLYIDSLYAGTTLFMDANRNTTTRKETADSLSVLGKVTFSGISSDSTTVPSGGIYFRASDGILRRKY